MSTPLPTFRVTFPARHTGDHCEAYLDELGDFADWRKLSPCVYIVMPRRRNAVDAVRADLQRQRDVRRLSFEEIAA